MTFTAKQVGYALKRHELDDEDGYTDWSSWSYWLWETEKGETFEIEGIGTVIIWDKKYKTASYSDGEEIYTIFRVGDQFFKSAGTYTSFIGSEFEDDLTEVQPVVKSYIAYEDKE